MGLEANFGSWLKDRRRALDLTQDELARRVGCSLVTIQKIEAGDRRASKQVAQLLAEHLKIPQDEHSSFVRFARDGIRATLSALAPTADHSPWRAMRQRHTNLPSQPTPLIGREQDVVQVQALLQNKARLVTLVGPPGIGKTRLAIQTATELLDDPSAGSEHSFADGLFFVDLAPISDPNLVIAAIAQVLSIKEVGNQPLADRVKGFLADKRILLLLDNMEQVIESAPFVAELLTACHWLRILATSRVPLHLRAEHQYPVPTLTFPNPAQRSQPDDWARYSAVQLFVDRAMAVKPDFVLNRANAAAVAGICARLDGLALAIELVAARSHLFSPRVLLTRLEKTLAPLKTLSGGPRDLPRRQRTMRNAIGWSYDLLEPAEQKLFTQLSVFVGGCTRLAAVATCDSSLNLDDGLASLVDKNLLRGDKQGDEERFTMLEMIREYALEKLIASEEVEEIRLRHAQFFLNLAENVNSKSYQGQQGDWLGRLEREQHNLHAALGWTLQHEGSNSRIGLRLCIALADFWELKSHHTEGRQWFERALTSPSASPIHRARLLLGAGRFAWLQGDFAQATNHLASSLRIFSKLGDKTGIASSSGILGSVARYQGDYVNAQRYYSDALAIRQRSNDQYGIAWCLHHLGLVAFELGDFDRARSLFETSLRLRREIGDVNGRGYTLNGLGNVAFHQGDLDHAENYYAECLACGEELSNKRLVAFASEGLGMIELERGEKKQASTWLETSLEIYWELRNNLFVIEGLEEIAALASADAKPIRAARLWGAAQSFRESLQAPVRPFRCAFHERASNSIGAQLGDSAFGATLAEGRAMTLEQAVDYALSNED